MEKIKGVHVFKPDVYTDYRGDLWTLWKHQNRQTIDCPDEYNHDKVSTSRKHVIRGIHGDLKSTKLVTCLYGELYFVVVDNNEPAEDVNPTVYKRIRNMVDRAPTSYQAVKWIHRQLEKKKRK